MEGEVPTEDLMARPKGSFGRWTVVSYAGKHRHESKSGAVQVSDMWNCECDCGRTKAVILKGNLVRHHSTQCRKCAIDARSKGERPHMALWWRYRSEMCAAWQDEVVFGEFCKGRTGKFLLRKDKSRLYSAENCYWSDRTNKGLLFREELTGLRMLVLGETREQAEAWIDSVTHQRRYQWFAKHIQRAQEIAERIGKL